MTIKNAIIKSVRLSTGDYGSLVGWVNLDYGGTQQGFGGHSIYSPDHKEKGNFAGHFIWRVMEMADVTEWEKLVGKTVRVNADHGAVVAIGHIVKDKWFNIRDEFREMQNEQ